VIIATKLRHGDANTMMAEGGIQVADQPGKDPPYYHYLDAMGGGHFANVPQLVYTLVTQASSALQWLERLGAMFDKNLDGSYKVLHLGGTSSKRVHVAADITDPEIIQFCKDRIAHYEAPKSIDLIDALSRTGSGKIHKKRIEGEILGRLREKSPLIQRSFVYAS
jgi:succinate dehydrogenase/fumarate reductase flavoprotein subunit